MKYDTYTPHKAHTKEVDKMKANIVEATHTEYQSEEYPEIAGTSDLARTAIEFLDANPQVMDIVTGDKSKAFGIGSCVYIGWAQRSEAVAAIVERIATLENLASGQSAGNWIGTIWNFRALYTLEYYGADGFTGGFFQQHDKRFPRSCLSMDYTPAGLPAVVKKFARWCDNAFTTERITIDGEDVAEELWRV